MLQRAPTRAKVVPPARARRLARALAALKRWAERYAEALAAPPTDATSFGLRDRLEALLVNPVLRCTTGDGAFAGSRDP